MLKEQLTSHFIKLNENLTYSKSCNFRILNENWKSEMPGVMKNEERIIFPRDTSSGPQEKQMENYNFFPQVMK